MADDRNMRETDLVLPYGLFSFVLENSKGNVNVYVGPTKQALSMQNEQSVVFDEKTGRFMPVTMDKAIQTNYVANKGQYIILQNPADKQPDFGKMSTLDPERLKVGERVNIAGPTAFALWPGQRALVVDGHQLKRGQYLIVRVYDDDAAKANWDKTVVKTADGKGLDVKKEDLYTGQLIVIKGTEVSFYIPPTGIEVLKNAAGSYVQDAVTLERLEYCLLLDENGNKRYVLGPDVVFPEPTESFVADGNSKIKFQAYELNELSGIHLKVIEDYEDDAPAGAAVEDLKKAGFTVVESVEKGNKISAKKGEELFVTGKIMPLYFPRPEHAIIKYGTEGRTRYHAVAIPKGEARYVMNRITGDVKTVRGPVMLLPDPRFEVFVVRPLSENECLLYYPGNNTVRAYNSVLRGEDPNGGASIMALMDAGAGYKTGHVSSSVISTRSAAREVAGNAMHGDVIGRGDKFTPPKRLILGADDTKYEGAIPISAWTGYAVQVVNKAGERRVVLGPQSIHLEYDERLESLNLSTGTPKTPDRLMKTAYLSYLNNVVSDQFDAMTSNMVPVRVSLKYLVRFDEAQKERWFNLSNYVQYLVDHMRSMLMAQIRSTDVDTFYKFAASYLRDRILGQKPEGNGARALRTFDENGMVIYDVVIADVKIMDDEIEEALETGRQEELKNTLDKEHKQRELELTKEIEALQRQIDEEKQTTEEAKLANQKKLAELRDELKLAERQREITLQREILEHNHWSEEMRKTVAAIQLAAETAKREADQKFNDLDAERSIKIATAEADAVEKKFKAVQPAFIEALVGMAQAGLTKEIAQHLAPLAVVKNTSITSVLEQLTAGTPMEKVVQNLSNLSAVKTIGK